MNTRKIISEEYKRFERSEALIEKAFMLYEQGETIEDKFSKEELNELLGGLKNLFKAGGKAVQGAAKGVANNAADKATRFGNSVSNSLSAAKQGVANGVNAAGKAVGNAGKAVGNAVGNAASATSQAVGNAANQVKNTYNQGEIEGVVADIQKLNDKYKKLTGKSFIAKYSAVAGPIKAGQNAAQPNPATQLAEGDISRETKLRMQVLSGLVKRD